MQAVVRKEMVVLKTYPYSDPSPLPEFGRIYPYNRHDGYAVRGSDQAWEMVVLENSFIKIWINPAVGGKVWGAVEKSTGREFIYFNHTAKFRDVAMRGPWTSGGIEFNVGIIGHSLSCSAPVDHHTRTNADGSVCCFIGATDWPSRTRWWVEIFLPAGAAWFRTRTSWYNNSGLEQAYYSWSNAGIKTAGGLEYIFPGDTFLGHDGKSHSWPLDEKGRDLSKYAQNDFGHYKSYHVFGACSDFWGCYWRNDDFGLGHYSPYDERPGKKIWIWGLSRYGMIWEDLLTDTDGQYSEVQSGRLFNQSISSSSVTPFKHRSFLPGSFDQWDEYWMPVKGTGGLSYACPALSFYLDPDLGLRICANRLLVHLLRAADEHGVLVSMELNMKTLENCRVGLSRKPDAGSFKLWLDATLIYDAAAENYALKRPRVIAAGYDHHSVEGLYFQGKEWERQRFFARAISAYTACLARDPYYTRALVGMAGLHLKLMEAEQCLALVSRALSIDSYDGAANYIYGLVNLRLGNLFDARDGFSIAGQAIEYRSAAMTELAKLHIRQRQYSLAWTELQEAMVCNARNCQAGQLQVFVQRRMGNAEAARDLATGYLEKDPLDHVLRFELLQVGGGSRENLVAGISAEWPHETFLELASFYTGVGAWEDALRVLDCSPEQPLVELWKAYLFFKLGQDVHCVQALFKAMAMAPVEVFPHRYEDLVVLQWAMERTGDWKVKYYAALVLLQTLQDGRALGLLEACGNEPMFHPFYGLRAGVRLKMQAGDPEADLLRAVALTPESWRANLQLSNYYADQERWGLALEWARSGYLLHPDNYYMGLQLAKCYLYNEAWEEGIGLMKVLRVLPNEGASEGRNVWRETNLHAAIGALVKKRYDLAESYIDAARTWPENLGVGRPYDVDERIEDTLKYFCLMGDGLVDAADLFKQRVVVFREKYPQLPKGSADLLSMLFLRDAVPADVFGDYREKWMGSGQGSLPLRWCRALLDGDLRQLGILSEEKVAPPVVLPYEVPFEDREFGLIKKMYHKGLLGMGPVKFKT